jgi:hypothetical protein
VHDFCLKFRLLSKVLKVALLRNMSQMSFEGKFKAILCRQSTPHFAALSQRAAP